MSKFTDAQITAMQDERFTVKQAAEPAELVLGGLHARRTRLGDFRRRH